MLLKVLLARASCFPSVRACYRRMERTPGLGGISRALMHLALPFGTKVWARVHSGYAKGLWLRVDPRSTKAYLEGWYELSIQNLLRQYLQNGGVFYDIGAHVGFFSLIAARLVGTDGAVFAFEAAPENIAALEKHIQRNALSQVHVSHVAVWSKCGRVVFSRPYLGALAGAVVAARNLGMDHLEVHIQAITLDCFVTKHRPPTLVKIDVEGGEADVLRGAEEVFRQSRPVLICEVHHQNAARAVQWWLAQRGYRFDWLTTEDTFPRHLLARPQETS